jgi:hypothetical protein
MSAQVSASKLWCINHSVAKHLRMSNMSLLKESIIEDSPISSSSDHPLLAKNRIKSTSQITISRIRIGWNRSLPCFSNGTCSSDNGTIPCRWTPLFQYVDHHQKLWLVHYTQHSPHQYHKATAVRSRGVEETSGCLSSTWSVVPKRFWGGALWLYLYSRSTSWHCKTPKGGIQCSVLSTSQLLALQGVSSFVYGWWWLE